MRDVLGEAIVLSGDEVGVATENDPRLIQENAGDNGLYCSLNRDWLEQLGLAEKSAATLHSMNAGVKPVVVQNPCYIIQPAEVIND